MEQQQQQKRLSKAAEPRGALAWIVRLTRGVRVHLGIVTVSQVLLALYGVALAWLLRSLIDSAVAGATEPFAQSAAAMIALVLLRTTLGAFNRWATEFSSASLENEAKQRLLDVLLTRDLRSVRATHSGEWMNRLTSDTTVVAGGIVSIFPSVFAMVAQLIGSVCLLVSMVPELGILLIVGGFALIGFSYAFRRVMKRLHKDIRERDGKLRILMTDYLGSLLVVRAFNREPQAKRRAQRAMQDHKAARMLRNRFSVGANIGFSLAMTGAYVVCAIWCGWGILQGAITYGTFIAVVQLVSQVQSPFANISGYLPRFYSMTASAERLMEAEGFEPEETERITSDEARALYANLTALGMEGVTFNYDDKQDVDNSDNADDAAAKPKDATDSDTNQSVCRTNPNNAQPTSAPPAPENGSNPHNPAQANASQNPAQTSAHQQPTQANARQQRTSALVDCTFKVEKGDLVALAGPSGCGKSTAMRLLMALYPPTRGACYLETASGKRLPLTPKYRALFAYVPQGNHLLSGTIRQALAFGNDQVENNDELLFRALDIACAATFVRALPDGLDTMLGEHGSGLSEGQIQRIAIARALVTRRPILMLDECTSSLDAPTELQVLQNLSQLGDVTVLAVTHRHQTLEAANKIIEFSRPD